MTAKKASKDVVVEWTPEEKKALARKRQAMSVLKRKTMEDSSFWVSIPFDTFREFQSAIEEVGEGLKNAQAKAKIAELEGLGIDVSSLKVNEN